MANPENKQIPYESTQKDIRDAIESVATAIGGIAIPSADHVSYDNSGSGLSATDVQNAIDEIVSDIPTVNDGTLTIQQNGETKGTFTANQSGNSTVNIETPTTDIQTAVDEFSTYNGGLLSSLKVTLSPIQDLSHGDPSPTNICPISGHTQSKVQNHQKNLFDPNNPDLPNTIIAYNNAFDVNNSFNTWKFEGGHVYTCSYVKGTGFDVLRYGTEVNGVVTRRNSATSPTVVDATNVDALYISLAKATDYLSNFQLELGSTATEYAPYNGYQITVNLGGTYYSGTLDVVSGVLTVDSAFIASYNGETLPSTWISDRDVYAVGTTPTTGAEVCYKLATPTPIQLSPTMVKALVGENHLSAPLEGQEITESKYKQMFTFDDVIAYIQSLS